MIFSLKAGCRMESCELSSLFFGISIVRLFCSAPKSSRHFTILEFAHLEFKFKYVTSDTHVDDHVSGS